ncbi:MAG: hypothetical protein JXD22_11645 [Sedimentisphaerales bacterium]|nr:hypothetical protein [Sedimentisphaerales bacterium]
MAADNEIRDRVVLLITQGVSFAQILDYCGKQGVEPDAVDGLIAEARKRITIAAEYNRDEQVGLAVQRLTELYRNALAGQDFRTALQAQRELNRLMGLYENKNASSGPDLSEDLAGLREQLDTIAGYVLPLGLTSDNYPLEEHVRLAIKAIIDNKRTLSAAAGNGE